MNVVSDRYVKDEDDFIVTVWDGDDDGDNECLELMEVEYVVSVNAGVEKENMNIIRLRRVIGIFLKRNHGSIKKILYLLLD